MIFMVLLLVYLAFGVFLFIRDRTKELDLYLRTLVFIAAIACVRSCLMNKHCLKIHKEHFNNVKAGTKTFEIRNNDRAFQKGDSVLLREFDPSGTIESHKYSGRELEFKIGDVYPIDAERVVFSLLPIEVKGEH